MIVRVVRSVLALSLVVLVGAGVGLAVKHLATRAEVGPAWERVVAWWSDTSTSDAPAAAGATHVVVVSDLPASFAASPAAPRPAASLDAAVIVAGTVLATSDQGRIALPSGTRFQLAVASDQGGLLEVHALNPYGQPSAKALWSTRVSRGEQIRSPALRLQGTRGLETLTVLLRAKDGVVLGERQLQIWHL